MNETLAVPLVAVTVPNSLRFPVTLSAWLARFFEASVTTTSEAVNPDAFTVPPRVGDVNVLLVKVWISVVPTTVPFGAAYAVENPVPSTIVVIKEEPFKAPPSPVPPWATAKGRDVKVGLPVPLPVSKAPVVIVANPVPPLATEMGSDGIPEEAVKEGVPVVDIVSKPSAEGSDKELTSTSPLLNFILVAAISVSPP